MEFWTIIKKYRLSIFLVLATIGLLCYHFFETENPPITQTVLISPVTTNKPLINGQQAQVKVATPPTTKIVYSGFSEQFVKDTIQKILQVKEKDVLAVNEVKGKYEDKLQLLKEELNEQKKLTKYYQSKDKDGNVLGNAELSDNGDLVYKGNINLISIIKKGGKKHPDSLIFYDPTERITINESKEFRYTLPKEKRLKISPQIGVGVVMPLNTKQVGLGVYGGVGLSYTF